MSNDIVYYQDSYQTVAEFDSATGRHSDVRTSLNPKWSLGSGCPICAGATRHVSFSSNLYWGGSMREHSSSLAHCDRCGWWRVGNDYWYSGNNNGVTWPRTISSEYWPIIKWFTLASPEAPINALREHLRKHYSDMRSISAPKAEELVYSVFKEHYRGAEVKYFRGCTFTPDDGIDLVVVDTDGGQIAVQVKRRVSRTSEPIEQVKSFVASFFMNGMRKGVYVALFSKFTRAAEAISQNPYLVAHGLQLELMDAERFYQILNSQALAAPEPVWFTLLECKESCSDEGYINQLLSSHRATQ
jgi:hypothetical protein